MLADTIPLYPLYALLFADAGLSDAEISGLFALWSMVAVVAEIPSGAIADRFSRRGTLVAGGLVQAAAYACWILAPGVTGFAAGFVLWGVAGALVSGSWTALVYDGLRSAGAGDRFARTLGLAEAGILLVQLPVAALAGVALAAGGYDLVGWLSVGVCCMAAVLATGLPDVRPADEADDADDEDDEPEGSFLEVLRAGLAEAAGSPTVRGAVLATGAVTGLDGVEEYSPLLAAAWGVPAQAVPAAIVAIPLVGALGAAAGARFVRVPRAWLGGMLLGGAAALGGAGLLQHPAGLAAVAAFYGLLRIIGVVLETRLQEAISGPSRATVTSVAGSGGELAALVVFGIWALGGITLVSAAVAVLAVLVPVWSGRPAGPRRPGGDHPESGPG